MLPSKKPKKLNLSYDEKMTVCEACARLSVGANKQISEPMKIDGALRRFPHRMDVCTYANVIEAWWRKM